MGLGWVWTALGRVLGRGPVPEQAPGSVLPDSAPPPAPEPEPIETGNESWPSFPEPALGPGENFLHIHEHLEQGRNFELTVEGAGNRLRVEEPVSAGHVIIMLKGNAHVTIDRGCALGNVFIYAGPGARIEIGKAVGFNGFIRVLAHEPRRIRIGDRALIAGEVYIAASDMHSIIDRASGERVNPARDIEIGAGAWIGEDAKVMKGVTVGRGGIVGASAVVTKDVPAEAVVVGNPARIVRRGVRWIYELV